MLNPVADAGVEAVRQPFRSHEWFRLTEGPVIDMDRLPRAFAHNAVLDRLARMRPGERLEIGSSQRMKTVQDLLARRGMTGVYGGPTWRRACSAGGPSDPQDLNR